tara:strand:+ start:77 stop:1153 length:1077 start_codon:yes stop_codon:yes gene_type:complete
MKLINQIEPLITIDDKKNLIKYLDSGGWLTEFKQNKIFEEKFRNLTKSKYCITLPNGTLTMTAILLALNLKKKDTILVSSYTMVATANAAKLLGLNVKFVDIDRNNLNMCPKDLLKKITKNIKAVVYTTMNGRSGHITEIKNICKKNKIYLIEDSAHSIGSYKNDTHHGNFGIASSFSLSMPKIITTGQGGVICTNNFNIYKKIKLIKDFGRSKPGTDKYKILGYNFKFTDLQACIGISQLKNIKKKIGIKKRIYKKYFDRLSFIKQIKTYPMEKKETPLFMDIYVPNRGKLMNYLRKKKIMTREVYPPLNKQKFFHNSQKLPIAEELCNSGLWLPTSLNLKDNQVNYIIKTIEGFYS